MSFVSCVLPCDFPSGSPLDTAALVCEQCVQCSSIVGIHQGLSCLIPGQVFRLDCPRTDSRRGIGSGVWYIRIPAQRVWE